MKTYLRFIGTGAFFAAVEEYLTVVVLRGDLGSFLFSVLILFPAFLTIGFFAGTLIDRIVRRALQRELIYFFAMGGLGLMIEWVLIGLAPWRDPDADPLLLLTFHLGMFSFWASVAYLPRLFSAPNTAQLRSAILRFYLAYFVIVYFVAFTSPPQLRFLALIALILFGYLFLNLYYLRYFRFVAGRTISLTGSPRNSP